MLKYYKITRKSRTRVTEPTYNAIWLQHGLSEFLGTITLSLLFAGLSIVVQQEGNQTIIIEQFFLHPFLVGFYAGFIGIGLLLVVFLRWSCDLNPAVTIVRMFNGTNTFRYGIFKIIIQLFAGIVAGLIIYGFGSIHSSSQGSVVNRAIDAVNVSNKQFSDIGKGDEVVGAIWIFIVELIATAILLFPIFSKRIDDKYRDVMIMLMISMAVFVGIIVGSAALNPARGIAQQAPALFFGAEVGASNPSSLAWATGAMLLGTFLSPFFYLAMQEFTDWINVLFSKAIGFKNYRLENMKKM